MVWQDLTITFISIGFTLFLIPQVRSSMSGNHVNPWMSGLTAAGLCIMGLAYATLGLWFSASMSFVTATVWAGIWGLWNKHRKTSNSRGGAVYVGDFDPPV